MKYLNENIQTLEELKKVYHKLCLKLHPDVGGSNEEMKILNDEYKKLFEVVKNKHLNKDGDIYYKTTNEVPEEFQDLISKLMKYVEDDVEVEIIGSFIWIIGNTYPHKNEFKKLGFKWHSKKSCWYKAPDNYHSWRTFGKEYSLDEIRGMYETTKVDKSSFRNSKELNAVLA